MISDLKKYKEAKIICRDLSLLEHLLTRSLTELAPYRKYVPIKYILNSILEQKAIIHLHLKKHQVILNNKGKIDDQVEKI